MRRHLLYLSAVACLGCHERIGPVDGPMATVTIYGLVTTPSGSAAPNVTVAAEAHVNASCANPRMDRATVVTGEMGNYRATLGNWGEEFPVCVNLRVTPATGLYAVDSVQRAPVYMRSVGPDSVRVDIVLRPGA